MSFGGSTCKSITTHKNALYNIPYKFVSTNVLYIFDRNMSCMSLHRGLQRGSLHRELIQRWTVLHVFLFFFLLSVFFYVLREFLCFSQITTNKSHGIHICLVFFYIFVLIFIKFFSKIVFHNPVPCSSATRLIQVHWLEIIIRLHFHHRGPLLSNGGNVV